MKAKIVAVLAAVFVFGFYGCEKTGQYDTDGIAYLAYTDIDTVCDTPELAQEGAELLDALENQLLLSFVMDSSIELSEELGEYDHLIMTNPRWVERFGEPDKLESVEYDSLSDPMREFLEVQMPVLTADGSVLPDGVGLYCYEGDKLYAFPVNVTLGGAKPTEAKNPLIILVDYPARVLKADACLLSLTSSGNVLFTDEKQLKAAFESSKLTDYATVEGLENPNDM